MTEASFPDVIYLDTSVLVASGWPSLSKPLRGLRDAAKVHNAKLIVPEPVLGELRQQFLENVIQKLEPELRRIGATDSKCDFLTYYDKATENALAQLDAEVCAFTSFPIQHFWSEAQQRKLPFRRVLKQGKEEKDVGFKDAVIWWTCCDHLGRSVFKRAVFATQDPDFPQDHTLPDGRRMERRGMSDALGPIPSPELASRMNGIGWLRIPTRTTFEFAFMTLSTRLSAAGGEWGAVQAASDCSPCKLGETVSVNSYFAGSFLGSGPAWHERRYWPKVYYYGELKISGPPLVADGGVEVVVGGIDCEGELTATLDSPMVARDAQLRVSVRASGRTAVRFSGLDQDGFRLLTFQQQDYYFDTVELSVTDVAPKADAERPAPSQG